MPRKIFMFIYVILYIDYILYKYMYIYKYIYWGWDSVPKTVYLGPYM